MSKTIFLKICLIVLAVFCLIPINSYAINTDNQNNINKKWIKSFGGSENDLYDNLIETNDGGFLAFGMSSSTNINDLINHGSSDAIAVKYNKNGDVEWANSFGGNNDDYFESITELNNGEYIAVGYTESTDIDGLENKGQSDFFLVKIDSNGNKLWTKSFGGYYEDYAMCVIKTNDNGFVVVGDGYLCDFEGFSNYLENEGYYAKSFIYKYDSNGNQQWAKSFGGDKTTYTYDILQTSDNGYMITGRSTSSTIGGSPNKGNFDAYVAKLNSDGTEEWVKNFGGNYNDAFYSIRETSDNGYILAGYSFSTDVINLTNNGNQDGYIVKLDNNGNQEWGNIFGGSKNECYKSVRQTTDNGYLVIGTTNSDDIDNIFLKGMTDVIVAKYNENGNIEWCEPIVAGNNNDWITSMTQTKSGDFVAVGYSLSTDIDATNNGKYDCFILRFNEIIKRLNITDTLDLQIVADNSLEMSLSTNQISFKGYNGVSDLTNNDLNITVTSGLYYDLFATLNDELRGSNDTNAIINKTNLGIKTSTDSEYKNFTNIGEPLKLVDNHVNGRNINHNINLKLKGDSSVKADTYSTSITFETTQK